MLHDLPQEMLNPQGQDFQELHHLLEDNLFHYSQLILCATCC